VEDGNETRWTVKLPGETKYSKRGWQPTVGREMKKEETVGNRVVEYRVLGTEY